MKSNVENGALVAIEPMTLYADSWMWAMIVHPDGKVISGNVLAQDANIPFSTMDVDYGVNAFGGIFTRVDKNGAAYPFLGENHWKRLEKSARVLKIYHPKGELGLPDNFISYKEIRPILLELRRLNNEKFGNDHFNYFRPTIRAFSTKFGVGNLSGRGYILTIENLKLEEGEYYKAGTDSSLLVVDPNKYSRPGHASEVTPCKRGGETYLIGAEAAREAKSKHFTDAILSCYDRDLSGHIALDCSSSCFAVVTGKKVIMPNLKMRALFGLTMQAELKSLAECGWEVVYDDVDDETLTEADFLITAGTAAGINLVTSVGWYHGKNVKYVNTKLFGEMKECFQKLVDEGTEHISGLQSF